MARQRKNSNNTANNSLKELLAQGRKALEEKKKGQEAAIKRAEREAAKWEAKKASAANSELSKLAKAEAGRKAWLEAEGMAEAAAEPQGPTLDELRAEAQDVGGKLFAAALRLSPTWERYRTLFFQEAALLRRLGRVEKDVAEAQGRAAKDLQGALDGAPWAPILAEAVQRAEALADPAPVVLAMRAELEQELEENRRATGGVRFEFEGKAQGLQPLRARGMELLQLLHGEQGQEVGRLREALSLTHYNWAQPQQAEGLVEAEHREAFADKGFEVALAEATSKAVAGVAEVGVAEAKDRLAAKAAAMSPSKLRRALARWQPSQGLAWKKAVEAALAAKA